MTTQFQDSRMYVKGYQDAINEVEKMIDDFIKYSDEEKKDNYLWYKFNLNNLKTKLQEMKEK